MTRPAHWDVQSPWEIVMCSQCWEPLVSCLPGRTHTSSTLQPGSDGTIWGKMQRILISLIMAEIRLQVLWLPYAPFASWPRCLHLNFSCQFDGQSVTGKQKPPDIPLSLLGPSAFSTCFPCEDPICLIVLFRVRSLSPQWQEINKNLS